MVKDLTDPGVNGKTIFFVRFESKEGGQATARGAGVSRGGEAGRSENHPGLAPPMAGADHTGRNFGMVASSVISSNTISTGMSQVMSSTAMPVTLLNMRGPSSSAITATA